jgi:Fe-S cluster biogenesis protein NfuA
MTAPTAHSAPTAHGAPAAEATARRVEELLERLTAADDPSVVRTAEELVRALMDFYGSGLARIVALLSGRSGNPLGALLDDEVTAGLLVLHDLHPDDTQGRIDRALRAADAGSLDVDGFDADTGTLRLRQSEAPASGCGCGSTAGAVRERVEAALSCFAPEVATVEIEQTTPREPVLLQIATRPPDTVRAGAR